MPVKKIRTILVITCLFIINNVNAQDSIALRPAYIKAGLLYDFPVSAGFMAGIQYPLSSVIKYKKHKWKQRDLFAGFEMGGYHYFNSHVALLAMPSIGITTYKSLNRYHSWEFKMGIMRTIYDGKVYAVDAAGNVQELSLFGRTYAITGVSYTAAWKAGTWKKEPLMFYIKPSLWIQYPYNSFIKPHVSFEAGVAYSFKQIKCTTKKKRTS